MLLNETIRLFLDSVGRSEEYHYYLKKFQSQSQPAFGLICPDLDSFREVSEAVLFDFQFLNKLELYPALLLTGPCAGEMAEYCRSMHSLELVPLKPDSQISVISQNVRKCSLEGKSAVLYGDEILLWEILPSLIRHVSSRIHFIRMRGSIHTSDDEILNYYRLHGPNPEIFSKDRAFVRHVSGLIDEMPGIHVSVCSSVNFLKEIFTVKGAGTVFRKGSRIRYQKKLSVEEKNKLRELLEKSFNKKIKKDEFLDRSTHFYIQEDFQAAAVLEDQEAGVYLNKFAVSTEGRGSGSAQELWNEIIKNHSAVFWRAREGNSINRWYASISDGMQKKNGWRIFWKGLNVENIPGIISFCTELEEDFFPVNKI